MAADSWGLSWLGTLGSWGTSWASTYVPPAPEEPTQTPAGSSRRKRRYFVEIDGQHFEVNSAAEAQELLGRARALAERAVEIAERKTERRVRRAVKRGKVPGPIRIDRPSVSASPELNLDLSPLKAEIERLYANAAAMIEMRILLEQRLREEDEEDVLLLLM